MADKGFAAAQATFPTLSFWGFGNFTPILFRWSQWHLCGGGVFFCCFEGKRRAGARVGTGLLHSRVFPGPAQRLFSPFLWVWLLSGFVWVGKETAESSLRCTLTKFVFRQWTGRVTSGQPFPFSFCSTESAPSANPGIAGSMATLLHDAVMNPAEVVKQRMQMYNSPHRSALSCVWTVWRTEGLGAFYRSYTTQLTMNIPFQSIHFITYEFLQEQVNPHRGYNPQSHIISGGLAGALAAAATTPLDVCKTLLNTQENMALNLANISGRLSGMANAFRMVYQLNGLPGYFKGMQARVIYQMPSTAISWSVYEFFKYFLTKHKLENRTPY
ncbi:mitoferrin-1 isoform X3 [Acinonyx jubatus]|uniref:Mitoferrin-1 n=1 Tax=Acinonyx jubatus TaxID=32536 RepID=A0ABM3PL40_ACIJB|nr:mitoferrin-1 isoform X3 [Acinonyx jubatus]